MASKSPLVGKYNYRGELIEKKGNYAPSVSEANSYLIFPVFDIDFQENEFISSQGSDYRIQHYDLAQNKLIEYFGKKTQNFQLTDEYIDPSLPRKEIQEKSLEMSFPTNIHLMPDFIVFNFENLTESFFQTNNFNKKDQYISIYDRNTYDFYEELSLPYSIGNISNEYLFLIENDNPDNFKIGIYKLNKVTK
jgi:hypothetical protein